ncbi:MAG: PT domain-containing protein [Candidatus Ornithomonoglobus sp.]
MKRTNLCFIVCALILLLGCGCSDKSALKSELEGVELTMELPPVTNEGSTRLSEIDDDVYRQQLAACEMYYEAYDITRTSDYAEKYKDEVKEKRVGYYCNKRRKELQLDIATQLHDNVYVMVKSVVDCANISAYLKRVNADAENFYDYYAAYMYSDDPERALCDILITFYERSNVLAFSFMAENQDEIIDAAIRDIISNAKATDSFNMYIAKNNELIKALNTVYGGVSSEYTEVITAANVALARKLLESDNDLSEDDIDSLMRQLGEATPEPEVTDEPTEKPTEEPTEAPTEKAAEVPKPTENIKPTEKPAVTNPPVVHTAAPTAKPTAAPETDTPAEVPEVYYFDLD